MRKFSNKKLCEVLSDPKYNISAIAKAAEISRSYIDGMMKGQYTNPGSNIVVAIADILGVEQDIFFEEISQHAVKEAS